MNSKENKSEGLTANLLNQILRLRVGRSRKEIHRQPHTTYTLELMDPEKIGIVPVKMDSFPEELAEKITGKKWLLEMAFVERSSREDPLQISFVVLKNPQVDSHYFMYDTLQGGNLEYCSSIFLASNEQYIRMELEFFDNEPRRLAIVQEVMRRKGIPSVFDRF